jgi:hypothetical protein
VCLSLQCDRLRTTEPRPDSFGSPGALWRVGSPATVGFVLDSVLLAVVRYVERGGMGLLTWGRVEIPGEYEVARFSNFPSFPVERL